MIDVREPAEWAAGHAPGAVHLPLDQVSVDTVPTAETVFCICRSGGRSGAATAALRTAGVDAVNVVGGMAAWSAAGLPVVRDDGRAGVVA